MSVPAFDTPTFGSPTPGVVYRKRPAAYAVIRDAAGAVAVIRVPSGLWLPGGGALAGEAPEEAAVREVREELGRDVRLLVQIGTAVQFFFAPDEDTHYEMTAVFFRAELVGEPLGPGEHRWHWLAPDEPGPPFFHACHAWAVRRDRELLPPSSPPRR
jgi:8-oxo-dGTP diphosphatase